MPTPGPRCREGSWGSVPSGCWVAVQTLDSLIRSQGPVPSPATSPELPLNPKPRVYKANTEHLETLTMWEGTSGVWGPQQYEAYDGEPTRIAKDTAKKQKPKSVGLWPLPRYSSASWVSSDILMCKWRSASHVSWGSNKHCQEAWAPSLAECGAWSLPPERAGWQPPRASVTCSPGKAWGTLGFKISRHWLHSRLQEAGVKMEHICVASRELFVQRTVRHDFEWVSTSFNDGHSVGCWWKMCMNLITNP